MSGNRTVTLSRPYEGATSARTPITAITFRAPRWTDYMALGEIAELQPIGPGGRGMVVRNLEAIEKYAERCLVAGEDVDAGFLQRLDLADALLVEEVISDFFKQARVSVSSQTRSSGATAGAPQTSGT